MKNSQTSTTVRHPQEYLRVQTHLYGDSLTHQSHADQCDINAIIRRYDNTGSLPPSYNTEPQYADVTHLQGDLTDRINTSRDTLDTAGRYLAEQQELQKVKEKELLDELKQENERLHALILPSQPDGQ